MKIDIDIEGNQGEGKSEIAHALRKFFDTNSFRGLPDTSTIIVEENDPQNNIDLAKIQQHSIVIRVRTIT